MTVQEIADRFNAGEFMLLLSDIGLNAPQLFHMLKNSNGMTLQELIEIHKPDKLRPIIYISDDGLFDDIEDKDSLDIDYARPPLKTIHELVLSKEPQKLNTEQLLSEWEALL